MPQYGSPTNTIKSLKRRISLPFFIEIIILMSWAIWTTRNNWLFNNVDPLVTACQAKFTKFILLLHRAKKKYFPALEQWLHNVDEVA